MEPDVRVLLHGAAASAPTAGPMSAEFRRVVRRRRSRSIIAAVACAAVIAGGSAVVASRLTRRVAVVAKDCGGDWTVSTAKIPSSSSIIPSLGRGLIVGASRYWATGSEFLRQEGGAFTASFDGRTWTRHEIPHVAGRTDGLTDIAGVDGNVWTVGGRGHYEQPHWEGVSEPLILRWNGSAWLTVDPPAVPRNSSMTAIAVDGDRVVVAGVTSTARFVHNYWEHWKDVPFLFERIGAEPWQSKALPDLHADYTVKEIKLAHGALLLSYAGRGGNGFLRRSGNGWQSLVPPGKPVVGVAMVSPDNLWAFRPFVAQRGAFEILHYDRRQWNARTITGPTDLAWVETIAVGVTGDAWVFGARLRPDLKPTYPPGSLGGPISVPTETVLFHWDGRALKQVVLETSTPLQRIGSIAIAKNGAMLALELGNAGVAEHGNLVLTRC